MRHHKELAEFIRSRRYKLQPESLGFDRGTRRRTPGLRREEVASLVGVSTSWYTKLEQGREIQLSNNCILKLAEVLQLSDIEREQLFSLSMARPPASRSVSYEDEVPALQRMIDAMPHSPAVIMTSRMDFLGSNAASKTAFENLPYTRRRKKDEQTSHNILREIFVNDHPKLTPSSWRESARYHVSVFRSALRRNSSDPQFISLVDELLNSSEEFRQIWETYELLPDRHRMLTYKQSDGSESTFEVCSFYTDINESLRVDIYTPLSKPA